jgi:peptide/nickel transport system substrate-binding protein
MWRRGLLFGSAFVFLGTASAAVPLGAAAWAAPSQTPERGGTLTIAESEEPDCLDPAVSAGDVTAVVAREVFDSLVAQDATGGLHPWLATSWSISPNREVYTFHLRKDVTFQDGTPFNAAAVKATFDHIVAPATKSEYAISLLGPYTGTSVVSNYVAQVHFSKPYAPFLQAASTTYLGVQSPKALTDDPSGLCTHPVGSGPFSLSKWVPHQSLSLVRNPAYHWAPSFAGNPGPAYLDGITYSFLSDDSVRFGALTSGQVDLATEIPPIDVSALKSSSTLQYLHAQAPGANYNLYLNTEKGPFANVDVRKAFQQSINLNLIIGSLYHGQYQRAWSPLGPTTLGFDPKTVGSWKYSLSTASKLLQAAGYTGHNAAGYRTDDGKPLVVKWPMFSPEPQQRDVLAQLIQAQVKNAGFDLQIEPLSIGTYLEDYTTGNYDIADYSFVRDDPDILRLIFSSTNKSKPGQPSQNVSLLTNSQVDGWLNQGSTSSSTAVQDATYAKVQEYVLAQADVVPMYVPSELLGASDPDAFPVYYSTWISTS